MVSESSVGAGIAAVDEPNFPGAATQSRFPTGMMVLLVALWFIPAIGLLGFIVYPMLGLANWAPWHIYWSWMLFVVLAVFATVGSFRRVRNHGANKQ